MLPLVSTVPLSSPVFTALSFGRTECGTKKCEVYEYCSKFHNDCESCAPVCDETSHNFDRESCITDCQNYLFDRNYVKQSDYEEKIKNIELWNIILSVIIVIIITLFIAFNAKKIVRFFTNSLAFLKKSDVKDKPVEPMTMANPHTVSPKLRIKSQNQANNQNNLNRTSSIFTVTGTEYEAKTVSTPISTRYPAEDTLTSSATVTPDYSYDNRGLQLTPVNEKPKIETTF